MFNQLKALAQQTVVYGFFHIFGRFLSFLLTPLYTNMLGASDFAILTYIFSFIAFFNVISAFGMESAFYRFYKNSDKVISKRVFSQAYYWVFGNSLIINGLLFITAPMFASSVSELPNAVFLIRLALLIPILDCLTSIPYAYLRMENKVKKFAYTRFLMIILGVVLNYVLIVNFDMGAEGAFYATIAASLLGLAVFLNDIIKNLTLKIDLNLIKEMLVFGIPTIPAGLSSIILNVGDKPIIKMITGSDIILAEYTANYRLGIPMMLIVSAFEFAFKPFYLNNIDNPDIKQLISTSFTYFSLICAVVFLSVALFIDNLVAIPFIEGKVLINPIYWGGLGIVPVILLAYYFNGAYNIFASACNITKKTRYLTYSIGIGTATYLIFILLSTPYIGYWGATWATLIGYIVSAAVVYFFSQKIYAINYQFLRTLKLWLIALAVFFAAKYGLTILTDWLAIGLKCLAIVGFVLLLYYFDFFERKEVETMKRLIKRR